MAVRQMKFSFVAALLLFSLLSGCLEAIDQQTNDPIDLIVYYDETNGSVEHIIQNGQLMSERGVELAFDFARVSSSAGAIDTIYFDPGDDVAHANRIEQKISEGAGIEYEYHTHGMFQATIGAIDVKGNEKNFSILIRIDFDLDWSQSNTDNPNSLDIDTNPDCECDTEASLTIDSTLSRNEFVPGTQLTVTWHLVNPDGNEVASHTEQIGPGQDASWKHTQSDIVHGMWTLDVTIDVGEGQLNVEHLLSINYDEVESLPNPFPAI